MNWLQTLKKGSVCLALAGGPVAVVQATDNTYQANTTGKWDNDALWSLGHVPDNTERAVIPSTSVCKIRTGDPAAVAESIDVQGTLRVEYGNSLTIEDDSTVDGLLELQGDPNGETGCDLVIAESLTISGDGEIYMNHKHVVIDDDGDNTSVLTVNPDPGGCSPLDPGCAVVLHGGGIIKVAMVNNAFVIADLDWTNGDPDQLCLLEHAKSGSGYWIAEAEGELAVQVEVTGAGDWAVRSPSGNGPSIDIEVCVSDLSGDVSVTAGKFWLNGASFCTDGDLTWDSADNTSRFVLTSGQAVGFGGVDCANACN